MKIYIFDILSIKQNFARIDIIESHHEIDKSTFTATGLTNKSNLLVWVNCDGKTFKNKVFFSSWISKPNFLEFNFTFDLIDIKPYLSFVIIHSACIYFCRIIHDLENSFCCSHSFAHIWTEILGISSVRCSEHNCQYPYEDINRFKPILTSLWIF